MFKTLFGRVEETTDPRNELYAEMRTSLYEYTEALNQYNEIRRDFDESSPMVSVQIATLEHHRSRYYNLRLKYESEYGNVDIYRESVSNVDSWAKKTGLSLLMRPDTDTMLYNRL